MTMFQRLELAYWRAQNHRRSRISWKGSRDAKSREAFLHVQQLGRIAELRSAIMAFYNRTHEEHWLRDKLEDRQTCHSRR